MSALVATLSIGLALALSGRASANPVAISPVMCFVPILGLIVFNFLPDLAILEFVAFISLSHWGKTAFREEIPERLVRKCVYACIFVSAAGAVTDIIFLVVNDDVQFDPRSWAMALPLIFVTVFTPMTVIVRTRMRFSALAGLVAVLVNALVWLSLSAAGDNNNLALVAAFSVAFGGVLFTIIFTWAIGNWYEKHSDKAVKEPL